MGRSCTSSECSSAIVGPLAFVGLIIPHIVRKLIGSNYKEVIPLSIILGGWFVVTTDLLGRTLHPPLEIPANVIMMLIGGPILIYILFVRELLMMRVKGLHFQYKNDSEIIKISH